MSSRQERSTTRPGRSTTRDEADDKREPSRSGSQPNKEPDAPQEKPAPKPSRVVLQKQIRAIEERLDQYEEQFKLVNQRLEAVEQKTQLPTAVQPTSEEAPPTPTTATAARKPRKLNQASSAASQAPRPTTPVTTTPVTKLDTPGEPAADNTQTNEAKPRPPKLNRITPAAKPTQISSAVAQPTGVKKPLNEARDTNQKGIPKKSGDTTSTVSARGDTTTVKSKPGDENEENSADVAARSVLQAAKAVKAVGDAPSARSLPKTTSAVAKRKTSMSKPTIQKEEPVEVVPRLQEPQFEAKPGQVSGNYNPATGEYEITLKSNMAQSGDLITRAIQKGVGLAGRFSGDLIQGRAKQGVAGAAPTGAVTPMPERSSAGHSWADVALKYGDIFLDQYIDRRAEYKNLQTARYFTGGSAQPNQ